MVRYNPKTWFALIFHSYSRYVMRMLLPALLFIGLYTFLFCFVIIDVLQWRPQGTTAVYSLLGIVLGLFLVFRMNSAYDRWWEGRKLWGLLVNNTRDLALKISAFLSEKDLESRSYFAQMIPNFVVVMREHLRQGVKPEDLDIVDEAFYHQLKGV